MQVKFNGRKVEITDIAFRGDMVDTFIDSAYYIDTEEELDDDELAQLTNENLEFLEQEWVEHQMTKAEDRADFLSDR